MARFVISLAYDSAATVKGMRQVDSAAKRTQTGIKSLGASLRGVAGALGAAVIIAKLRQIAAESMALAREQAEAFAQVEQAVRSTGGAAGFTAEELAKMASGLQRVTTFGDEAVLRAQSIILTFTKIGEETFPRTTEAVLNVATRMGTDLRSAALQVGKALNDPIRGLDGLQRAGIQFTDRQKEVIKSLAETGDLAAAQGLILEELETQFGGAAQAAAQAAGGGLKQFNNALGDLQEKMGAELLSAMDDASVLLLRLNRELTDTGGSAEVAEERTRFLAQAFQQLESVPILGNLIQTRENLKLFADVARQTGEDLQTVTVKSLERYSQAAAEGTLSTKAMGEAMEEHFGKRRLKEIADAIDLVRSRMKALERQHRENLEAIQDQADAWAEAERAFEEMADSLERPLEIGVEGLLSDLSEAAGTVGREVGLEVAQEARDALIKAANDAKAASARAISDELEVSVANALVAAFRSGDVATALESLFSSIGQLVGSKYGAAGTIIGGALGQAIGGALGGIFGDKEVSRRFTSVVNLLSGAATRLEHAARDLAEAARRIRERFTDFFRALGGFGALVPGIPKTGTRGGGGPTGGGGRPDSTLQNVIDSEFDALSGALAEGFLSLIPDLQFVVNQTGDQFHVSLQGLVSGVGDSLESATRNMFDQFAQRLPYLIETGQVSLAGVPAAIADVLRNKAFQTFEELQAAIENASRFYLASIGQARADIFTSFADLRVAVSEGIRNGLNLQTLRQGTMAQIEQFINQLAGVTAQPLIQAGKAMREFKAALEGLNLTTRQAERLTDRFRDAVKAFNLSAKLNVLGPLAQWAEQLGVNLQLRRRVARMEIRLQFLQIKLQAQTLGFWAKVRGIARDLRDQMLAAVKDIGKAANEVLGGLAGGRDGRDGPVDVRVTELPPEPLEPTFDPEEFSRWWRDQLDAIRSFGERLSPLEQLQRRFKVLFDTFAHAPHMIAQLEAAFRQGIGNLLEAAKEPVRDFLRGLQTQEGFGNLFDRIATASQQFQDALADGLATLDFSQATGAAQTLLGLARDAFGTSSAEYQAILRQVQEGLGDALTLEPESIADQLTAAMAGQTTVIVDTAELRRTQAERHHAEALTEMQRLRYDVRQLRMAPQVNN